jgi:Rieske Fe-S protein
MEPTSENLSGERVERRTFFQWLTYGLSGAAAAAAGIPLIGYVVAVPGKEGGPWVDLGPVDRFPINETRRKDFDNPLRVPWDGVTALTGVYVRNLGLDQEGNSQFLVFAVNCAHLGCPVSWFPESGLFMCPCHGGVYYANGDRASGPPPRGLYHCDWRVRDGRLEIEAPHFPTLQYLLVKSDKGSTA